MKFYKPKIISQNRTIGHYVWSVLWIFIISITEIQAELIFSSVTKIAQIDFVHSDGRSQQRLFNEFVGAGVAFFDYDNDGDLDLYLPNGARQTPAARTTISNQMYQNRGDGTFRNMTSYTNLGHDGYGVGCAVGDYDNDGFTDLYLTNFGADVLYKNQGDGSFKNVTQFAKIDNSSWHYIKRWPK